jgi:hypothetical protein
MITSRNTGVERTSTLEGQKVAMSIDLSAEAVASMMRSMIDLYNDQELACIREYATNADDAHIMAGNTAPIEVTLPGPLSPFYVVRDYGIGLSVDDIFEVYSKYGASTKRDSNDVQGMLGYGCKAALSYTPQFTVTSVKDGVRAQIAVSREGDGGGSMQVVDTSATDEGNGTTITIPVRRDNGFEDKARLFFSFWPEGSVLINGKAPERVEGLPVGDNMTVIQAPENRYGHRNDVKSYVVMGKVAYPAEFPGLDIAYGYGLVAWVGMGDVNFTPSREGLMEQDPTTIDTLRRVVDEFSEEAPLAIQRAIDKATSAPQALKIMVEYQAMLPNTQGQTFAYGKHVLPSVFNCASERVSVQQAGRHSHTLSSCSTMHHLAAREWPVTLWIEGHDGVKFTPSHKRKLNKYVEDNGLAYKLYNMTPGRVPAAVRPFITKDAIVQWSDIKAIKLPQVATSGASYGPVKSISGSYGMWVGSGDAYSEERLASDIDTSKPIFHMNGNRHETRMFAGCLLAVHPGATFVHMPQNRVSKFERDFPKSKGAASAVQAAWKAWKAKLTTDVIMAMAMEDAGVKDAFAKLDILSVNDPDVKRSIRVAKIDLTRTMKERRMFQYIVGRHDLAVPSFTNPLAKYPLVNGHLARAASDKDMLNHFYIYVNAAHAVTKGV